MRRRLRAGLQKKFHAPSLRREHDRAQLDFSSLHQSALYNGASGGLSISVREQYSRKPRLYPKEDVLAGYFPIPIVQIARLWEYSSLNSESLSSILPTVAQQWFLLTLATV